MAITDPPPWGWQWPPQQNFAWPGPQTFHLGGWRCPGCGRCWNPSVLSCEHCGPNPAVPAEDFTDGAEHDLCAPPSEGGLCDHDDQPQRCTGGRHVPASVLDDDLLRLKVIVTAKEKGLTWSQIGSGLGMSGREAKRHAHHLARSCQRKVVTRDVKAAAG